MTTPLRATIQTNRGDIRLHLFKEEAPLTVASFVNLAQHGFYNGIRFHRVIPNFVIQAGCPLGTGTGGPGYRFEDEFHPTRRHNKAGILSMANAGPRTNGSQFFITHTATPHLDDRHTVFGEVIDAEDLSVVNAIQADDIINTILIEGDTVPLLSQFSERVADWNKHLAKQA